MGMGLSIKGRNTMANGSQHSRTRTYQRKEAHAEVKTLMKEIQFLHQMLAKREAEIVDLKNKLARETDIEFARHMFDAGEEYGQLPLHFVPAYEGAINNAIAEWKERQAREDGSNG